MYNLYVCVFISMKRNIQKGQFYLVYKFISLLGKISKPM